MAAAKRICLNMIVKNEIRSLEPCLRSVAPFISCWVIGDTGSTDGTQDFIKAFFAERGIPGELHCFPFIDFGQARNQALDYAYASPLQFDYLLFNDADMEVVVEDPDFRSKLDMPGYMFQIRSGISYWLTRLVRRDSGTRYRGVTHEYLDLPGGVGRLEGVWIFDHATGSNRVEKFERDIRLLRKGLEAEPDNVRYQFYLAESLLNAGRPAEAAEAYAKRIAMGGWEEEVWYSCMQRARCFWRLEDEASFVREAVSAFDRRPHRAEPLYDLARFYRQRGMNEASVLFAEAGLNVKWPAQDVLFIEDFVYRFGLAEEYSIAANYARDSQRKAQGFAACDWLALHREAPESSRGLARRNLQFYAEPAAASMPSFAWRRLQAPPHQEQRGARVSVARHGARIVALWTGAERHFLLELDEALAVMSCREISGAPDPSTPTGRGFANGADIRVFACGGELWRLAPSPRPPRRSRASRRTRDAFSPNCEASRRRDESRDETRDKSNGRRSRRVSCCASFKATIRRSSPTRTGVKCRRSQRRSPRTPFWAHHNWRLWIAAGWGSFARRSAWSWTRIRRITIASSGSTPCLRFNA